MNSYEIQLFLHIVAALVAISVTFSYPFMQAYAERRGVASTRFAMQFFQYLYKYVVNPGAVLVILFDIGLIFDDRTGYTDDMPSWLWASITIYTVAVIVAVTVQRMNVKAAIEALEGVRDDEPLPERYVAVGKRIQIVGGLLGLSVLVVLFFMVIKPWE